MPFILRVDIDKPFGHHNLSVRILSKLREDYFFPPLRVSGYLKPVKALVQYLNDNQIRAVLYFRRCTSPDSEVTDLLQRGGHTIGFHAEDTRTFKTFLNEFQVFQSNLQQQIVTFTKHGNGTYKLGRNHFPPYEPEKYKQWAKTIGLSFTFGNGIASSLSDLSSNQGYYENMFWLEESYRSPYFNDIRLISNYAADHIIPIVVHPANYYTYPKVQDGLKYLVEFSKQFKIGWINPFETDERKVV